MTITELIIIAATFGAIMLGGLILYLTPDRADPSKRYQMGNKIIIAIGTFSVPFGVVGIFMPKPIPTVTFLILVVGVIVQRIIQRNQTRKLIPRIITTHSSNSAFVLPLGNLGTKSTPKEIYIWFMKSKEEWPPITLKIGWEAFLLDVDKIKPRVLSLIMEHTDDLLDLPSTQEFLKENQSKLEKFNAKHRIDVEHHSLHPTLTRLVDLLIPDPNNPTSCPHSYPSAS